MKIIINHKNVTLSKPQEIAKGFNEYIASNSSNTFLMARTSRTLCISLDHMTQSPESMEANPWEVQRLLKVDPFRRGRRKSSTNSPYLSRTGFREINQSSFENAAFRRNFNGNILPPGAKSPFKTHSKFLKHIFSTKYCNVRFYNV